MEVLLVLVGLVWFGRGYRNECWKRLCNPEQSVSQTVSESVSQSVTKVGIELLGQLKNRRFGPVGRR